MSYTSKESLREILIQLHRLYLLTFCFIKGGSVYQKGESYIVFYGCYEMLSSFIDQLKSERITINKKINLNTYVKNLSELSRLIKPMFEECPYKEGEIVAEFHQGVNYLNNILDYHRQNLIHQHDNFFNFERLSEYGFEGFITIEELNNNSSVIPKKRGVYIILLNEKKEEYKFGFDLDNIFLEEGSGGFFKGKNPNVPLSTLRENFHPFSNVMYIGKAGSTIGSATLHSRINQYLKFGQGRNIGHYGGRYIWQLSFSKKLIVAWKPLTQTDEESVVIERKLLNRHENIYDCLPFANLI